MAVKSIIDIDLNDAKFKDLQKTIHEIMLDTMSSRQAAALHAMAEESVNRILEKQRPLSEKIAAAWRSTAQSTGNVLSNVRSATATALRWASIGSVASGLLGLGGLWGLERMGEGVAARRRLAMGTGAGYGAQSAFELNFSRFVDPHAVMGAVGAGQTDVTSDSYRAMRALGLSGQGDTANVAVQVLKQLPRLFAGTPQGLIGPKAQALGIPSLGVGVDDIRRYLAASPQERARQESKFIADSKTLDLQKEAQRQWQDFTTQMMRAAHTIENVFVRGLSPLLGPIESLSGSFVNLVEALGRSDTVKNAIHSLSGGLEDFSKYVGTPEFKQGVIDFGHGVVDVGRGVLNLAQWLALVPLAPGQGGEGAGTPARFGSRRYRREQQKADDAARPGVLDRIGRWAFGGNTPPPADMIRTPPVLPYNMGAFRGTLDAQSRLEERDRARDGFRNMAREVGLPGGAAADAYMAGRGRPGAASAWDTVRVSNRSNNSVTLTVDGVPGGNVPDVVNQVLR